jgi:uncharacterized damage-inducible protein DinB
MGGSCRTLSYLADEEISIMSPAVAPEGKDAAWHAAAPSGKGRTIAAHIHHVRLMWPSAFDKHAKSAAKLQPVKATRQEVQVALKESALACELLLQKGYLIDSHHRGQIAMLARQVDHPVDAKAAYGLWERGSLLRQCGLGRTSGDLSSR